MQSHPTKGLLLLLLYLQEFSTEPIVINTWPFTEATDAAFDVLTKTNNVLDSVEFGCNICEVKQCDFTVGYGGSPDDTGETTLDAMIMDGQTLNIGAVGYLRRIKDAIKVARKVLHHSSHSIVVGDGATRFAKMMGFQEESLSTTYSQQLHTNWVQHSCQPNSYRNVIGQTTHCPPYQPKAPYSTKLFSQSSTEINYDNHDTIGMVVVNSDGHVAAGTSSNGALHKIAGRIGDAPIVGAGSYADNTAGGAAATGDGDIMMRFLPTFQAVQYMRAGMSPTQACETALRPIILYYPQFKGGIVCANTAGEYGAAGYGWIFSYSIKRQKHPTEIIHVTPLQASAGAVN